MNTTRFRQIAAVNATGRSMMSQKNFTGLSTVACLFFAVTFLWVCATPAAAQEQPQPSQQQAQPQDQPPYNFNDPEYLRIETMYMQTIKYYNKKLEDNQARYIARNILFYSRQFKIDPRLVMALFVTESNFNPSAVSPKGAQGLGQLMPGTARYLGVTDPFDVRQNIYGAIRYLREQYDRWRNQPDVLERMLASYNAGPEAVAKYNGVPPYRETQNFVKKIKKLYKYFVTGAK